MNKYIPRRLVKIENALLDLLQYHPMMPPGLSVRGYSGGGTAHDAGHTSMRSNLYVQLINCTYETNSWNNEYVSAMTETQFWRITLDIDDDIDYLSVPVLQSVVVLLMTNLHIDLLLRPFIPTTTSWSTTDENGYYQYSMVFKCQVNICNFAYYDPEEDPPKLCFGKDCNYYELDIPPNLCFRVKNNRIVNACKDPNDSTPGLVGPPLDPDSLKINVGIYRNSKDKFPIKEDILLDWEDDHLDKK